MGRDYTMRICSEFVQSELSFSNWYSWWVRFLPTYLPSLFSAFLCPFFVLTSLFSVLFFFFVSIFKFCLFQSSSSDPNVKSLSLASAPPAPPPVYPSSCPFSIALIFLRVSFLISFKYRLFVFLSIDVQIVLRLKGLFSSFFHCLLFA